MEESAPVSPVVSSGQHPGARKPTREIVKQDVLARFAADNYFPDMSTCLHSSERPSLTTEAQETIHTRSLQDAMVEEADIAASNSAVPHDGNSTDHDARTLDQQSSDLLLSVKAELSRDDQKPGAPKLPRVSDEERSTNSAPSVAPSEATIGRENSILVDMFTKADRMNRHHVSSSQAPTAPRGSSADVDPSALMLTLDEEDEVTVHLSILGAPAEAIKLTLSSFEGYTTLNGFLAAIVENYDDHVNSVSQIKALRLSSSDTAFDRIPVSNEAAEKRYQRFFWRAIKDKVMSGGGGDIIFRVELQLHKET